MFMIKIAIVDDIVEDLVSAKNILINYMSDKQANIEKNINIDTFSCGEDFLKNFYPSKYSLIILDICMKGINGIKAAQVIRSRDRTCKIIFLTNSEDFLLDGYSVFASGYIIKPITENQEQLAKTLDHIMPDLLEKIQVLDVKVKSFPLSIPYNKIYYVDINEKHHLRINFQSHYVIVNLSYKDCQLLLLTDKRFLECHHRIIVNMECIKSMEEEDFVLNNGVRVPISQRRRREAKLKYMKYLIERSDQVD